MPGDWGKMSTYDKEWEKASIEPSSTIANAIFNLNSTGFKLVLVVGLDKKLIGTISDGDIRRGLLSGVCLEDSILKVANKNPLVVNENVSRSEVIAIMRSTNIQQIPIIDKFGQLVGMHLWEEISNRSIPNKLVIMAGGKGVRLQPATNNSPKPMLLVAGKPILEHVINHAKKQGIKNFVIAIHYLGGLIEDYFQDGTKFGVSIEYIREENPLGTAGALSLYQSNSSLPIVVINGDVLSDVQYPDLIDFHVRNKTLATIVAKSYEWQNPFGVVTTNGLDVIEYSEKPIHLSNINAGIYVLDPKVIDALPKGIPLDMSELIMQLLENREKVTAYFVYENWMDLGRPQDLIAAQNQNMFKKIVVDE
jgi:dTDP-glucose pyrophosphorylase/predicted transcriptional regulator